VPIYAGTGESIGSGEYEPQQLCFRNTHANGSCIETADKKMLKLFYPFSKMVKKKVFKLRVMHSASASLEMMPLACCMVVWL
jgi:hypothetical protein